MNCKVKDNSLKDLRNRNIIDDVRFVVNNDIDLFQKENKELTEIANKVYGLDTGDALLYKVERVSNTYGRDVINSRERVRYLATPDDVLFDELQQLFDIKNAVREDQIAIVENRTPEIIKAHSGYRYNGSGFFHYSLNSNLVGNNGKQVLMSNDKFLIQSKDKFLFENLVKEFEGLTGYEFDINDKTAYGKKMHIQFFEFVSREKIKGLELIDSNGDTHLIKFENDIIPLEEDEVKTEDTFDVSLPVKKSSLENREWYDPIELDHIYEVYTPEQVNQMLEENEEDAVKVFNTLLYPDEFNNDIFVDSRSVNDQIRNCK